MADPSPIERGIFRDAPDGATVFFPWGLAHRGYRLPDAGARQRAARAVSLLIGTVLGIATWTAHRLQPLVEKGSPSAARLTDALAAPLLALAAAFLLYFLWATRFVEPFPPSDLRLSRDERLDEAARLAEPGKLAAAGLVLAGLSAAVFWIQPSAWWVGALGIALGLTIALLAWLLVRRRARSSP